MKDDRTGAPDGSWSVTPALLKIIAASRFLVFFVAVSTLLALAASFLLPKWYKSSTTLLPPKNQNVLNGLGGMSSLLKDFLPVSAAKGLSQGGPIITSPS
jgi:uncharacterized protein involved in exopolysaccharide biosynthesis